MRYTDVMQDDDTQRSYEQLDETNPEHNRRSFFDWLRGKEETDEEKLRKKLDEELKQAARQRAQQFEEEQRVEEKREVSETRKLKKRWRTKLVEKSKKLLEEVSERGDEPTNGYEIAKLMVAERIVKLHDILQTEDLRRSEVKTLKIHIDFMGLLSEKLDKPELEVPEEVEALYQTIATSVKETTGDTPPQTTGEEPEVAPVSAEDAAYTAFASSIVRAIRRALRSETPNEALAADGAGFAGASVTPDTPVAPPVEQNKQPAFQSPQAEQLLAIVKGSALSGEALRQEISRSEHARRLADVVEKAAIIDRYVSHEAHKTSPSPTENRPEITPLETDTSSTAARKKLKFMSNSELLALATAVEIGSGRLLADVYAKGELDREGLIKVLESYQKGRDYRNEFMRRRNKWRRRKQPSLESLSPPAPTVPATVPSTTPTSEDTPERLKNFGRQTLTLPLSTESSTGDSRNIGRDTTLPPTPTKRKIPELSRLVGSAKERLKRQGQFALLLTSVFLVVIVVIVVIELSSL